MTLIEVVVAFTLFLLAVMAALSLLGTGLDLGKSGEQRVLAGHLAESVLERERSRDFLVLAEGTLPLPDSSTFASNVTVQLEVTTVNSNPPTKRLRVLVGWDTKRGRASLFREAYLVHDNR